MRVICPLSIPGIMRKMTELGSTIVMGSEKNKCAGLRRISESSLTWFVCKAHPPVHISGYVLVDATQ